MNFSSPSSLIIWVEPSRSVNMMATKRGIHRHVTRRRSRILYPTQKGFDDGLIYFHDLVMEEPMRLIVHQMNGIHVRRTD